MDSTSSLLSVRASVESTESSSLSTTSEFSHGFRFGSLPRPPEIHSDFDLFSNLVCMWLLHSRSMPSELRTLIVDDVVALWSSLESLPYEVYVLMLMHFGDLHVIIPHIDGSFLGFYATKAVRGSFVDFFEFEDAARVQQLSFFVRFSFSDIATILVSVDSRFISLEIAVLFLPHVPFWFVMMMMEHCWFDYFMFKMFRESYVLHRQQLHGKVFIFQFMSSVYIILMRLFSTFVLHSSCSSMSLMLLRKTEFQSHIHQLLKEQFNSSNWLVYCDLSASLSSVPSQGEICYILEYAAMPLTLPWFASVNFDGQQVLHQIQFHLWVQSQEFDATLHGNGDKYYVEQMIAFDIGYRVHITGPSRVFQFIGQIVAASLGWLRSFLTFFYGSSPRPPDLFLCSRF